MTLTDGELEAYADELEKKFGADHLRRISTPRKKREGREEQLNSDHSGRRRPRRPEQQETEGERTPAQTPQATKEVKMTEQTSQREQSPFGRALWLARQIEDRDADTSQLKAAMAQLDDNGRRNLVFRLVSEVLEGHTRVPGLFAAARAANLITVAYNTAAVYNAARRGGLSLQDLVQVGLAEPTTWTDRAGKTRSRLVYRVGREALRSAALELRKQRKIAAAEVLENHLLQAEKRLIVRQAVRDRDAEPKPTEAEPADEAEASAEA